jgi:hypothetical protein
MEDADMTANARHSMDSPDWYTPTELVVAARNVMGGIDLDPASDAEANARHNIRRIYTVDDDGLQQRWFGRVLVNPPGGLVAAFWNKTLAEYLAGHCEQVIWIGYSLEQLQTLQQCGPSFIPVDYPTCFTAKRIAFVENKTKRAARIAKLIAQGKKPTEATSPSHSNYISYLGPNVRAFVKEFYPSYGKVRL